VSDHRQRTLVRALNERAADLLAGQLRTLM
jgi:hypothetical protein